jgi:membrane protein DedA with SNARE-associated domain
MTDYLPSGSYLAIIVVLVLTGMGLPIPEEVPIIAAGVISAHGQLDPWLAFACCVIGALLGDSMSYWIGYRLGRSLLRRHRWWGRYVTPEREQKIEEMIRAHGFKVFFLARFLIGLRSTIYVTAGILRMSFRRFILIDGACAAIIIGVFFGLSYLFGEAVTAWIRRAEWTVTVVVVLVVAGLAVFFWQRHRRKLLREAAAPAIPAADSPTDLPADPDRDSPGGETPA